MNQTQIGSLLLSKWRSSMLIGLLAVGAAGCGKSSTPSISDGVAITNASLSPEEALQRFAIEKVLAAMLSGAREPFDLQFEIGNIDFQEPLAAFYGTKQRLVHYAFEGPPRQGEQSVILTFDDKPWGPLDTSSQLIETRVYRVVDGGGRPAIVRAR